MNSNGAPGVASPSTLLSRSRYLLQSLAFSIAASGRDDYGRAPGQLLPEHTATPLGQRQRALWITVPPCARVSTQQLHEENAQRCINANAKTCKCE
eukprot:6212549-Pleurochrysis_carterae.AAC.7